MSGKVDCTCNMTFNANTGWHHHPSCASMQWQPGHLNSLTAIQRQFGEVAMDPMNDPERRLVSIPAKEADAASMKDFPVEPKDRADLKARYDETGKQLKALLEKQQKAQIDLSTGGALSAALANASGLKRVFSTGATRDSDEGKNDYEGFLSPLVLREFGDYMTEHRVQSDGTLRASDNWQKGIPTDAYMKSLLRHVFDLWLLHRGYEVKPEMRGGKLQTPTKRTLLCSIMFNAMGYLHELLKEIVAKPEAA